MTDEPPDGKWKIVLNGFEGPIAREGYDDRGNYYTVYENGAESWVSAEILDAIADGLLDSPEEPQTEE